MSATRVVDVVVALVLGVLLLPLACAVALAVVIDSRGGAFHRAARVGRGGVPFRMWKLRTMHVAAPGPRVTAGDDPRVTRVGRVLRRLHLDEIPQLWNVLRGDMGLVGPRPEDPALVDARDVRWRRVLAVRPGMTGPTQLAWARREALLLRGSDPERAYREHVLPAKLASDVAYVGARTFRGDLALLARTLAAPFARGGA